MQQKEKFLIIRTGFDGRGGGFVLAVMVGIVMFRAGEKPQAGSDIPLDILAANASQLSITTMHWTER